MNNEKVLLEMIEKKCKIYVLSDYDEIENVKFMSYRICGKILNIIINLNHISENKISENSYKNILFELAKDYIIKELGKQKLNELFSNI